MTFLRHVNELSAAWLSTALDAEIRGFTAAEIGTGQCASTYRVTLDWDGPFPTVILKLADPDPAVRRTGVVTGQYRQEVAFYSAIAPQLPQEALTACYAAAYDTEGGYFTLLLQDVAPAVVGDQLAGTDVTTARVAVRALARLVAPTIDREEVAAAVGAGATASGHVMEMLLERYLARYGDRISAEHRAVVERFVPRLDTWRAGLPGPRAIVHGDYRLDNMLLGEDALGVRLTVVDWATLQWGPLGHDLAYFVGGNLSVEDRRAHEKELVELFHETLVEEGVAGISFEDCWQAYRWSAYAGVLMAVGAPMVVTQTERGDELFLLMLERHCEQVLDLASDALLAEAHRESLRVDPADEGQHAIGEELFWNESWYFDAISDDGTLGAYVRVGFVPNLGHVVYTAYVVGEGRPSVAVLDYQAPLPAEGLAVVTERFTSDLVVEEPLRRFRVLLDGEGESYADPAVALRGEAGVPARVSLDLVWETEGEPYQYPVGTRYEMPCRVNGTITVDGEELVLLGPGQRDHSWGDRNWWGLNWTWATAHLDDGTRIQVIEARVPGLPVVAAGYEQREGKLVELKRLEARYDIPADRMPGRTTGVLAPSGTALTWEPIAYGPLRLTAPDGRVCEFPRAMARVTTEDGRTGLGWIEWGENVPAPAGLLTRARLAASRGVEQGVKAALGRLSDERIRALLGGSFGRRVVARSLESLPARINADDAKVANARVRFKIGGGASGAVDVHDLVLSTVAPARMERIDSASAAPKARLTLSLGAADLVLLGLGRLDMLQAALDRTIVIEGDSSFLLRLAPMLTGPTFPPQLPAREPA